VFRKTGSSCFYHFLLKLIVSDVIGMKSCTVFIVLILFIAVAVSACISQEKPNSSIPPTTAMTEIKVAYVPLVSNGPLFIAKDEGFFTRQGISVEFVKFQSVAASLPVLINGDIAVSGGTLSPGIINSIAKGANVRIVAEKGKIARDYCTVTGIIVRQDLFDNGTVSKVSDLRGRKIMASNDQQYTLFRSLALGNLTPDDVEIISMDYPSALVALKNQAIDGGLLTEPYITQAVTSGAGVVLVPAQDCLPDYPYVLYYGPAILEKNPDLGRRFMTAYLQGVRQFNKGKTEQNLAILQNYTSLGRDLLNESCWVKVDENGTVSTQAVREYIDWMYANKQIPQSVDENMLYDMSYVTYARGVLQNTTDGLR
jgi:NitT/TauT family transport system substrate-binding protein